MGKHQKGFFQYFDELTDSVESDISCVQSKSGQLICLAHKM